MTITAEMLINSSVIFCAVFLLSRILRAESLPSFPRIAPQITSSHRESRLVSSGTSSIAAAIIPRRDNPPARYSPVPDVSLGKRIDAVKRAAPAAAVHCLGICLSSARPITTSLIGSRLARAPEAMRIAVKQRPQQQGEKDTEWRNHNRDLDSLR